MPSSTRHISISRPLPKISAAAPISGCTTANENAVTAERPAAVATVTDKSSATCGNTGSIARVDRLAAKVASAMILRSGGSLCFSAAAGGTDVILGGPDRSPSPAHQTPSAFAPTPRTHAVAPYWGRPTAHDRDRDESR